ncbi:MAG: ABC transporter ATP-binding protein [Alphaproteobacteria bacterium]|nr:ABC transporter ATP-binding protein [Alphaproteobacteria bacterium]
MIALDGLCVRAGKRSLIEGLDLSLGRERLGIVGESGSGKSLTARAMLGLLPRGLTATWRRYEFDGRKAEPRRLRGRGIGLVMQDPKQALNPVLTVGEQLRETLAVHGRKADPAALLDEVGLAPETLDRYPHQLSGGMGQRAMIALALAPEPRALICDEAISALDPGLALTVLALLDRLVARRGLGLIFISHDLGLVARFCDRLMVMNRGRAVETLAARDLARAAHPYTRELLVAAQ